MVEPLEKGLERLAGEPTPSATVEKGKTLINAAQASLPNPGASVSAKGQKESGAETSAFAEDLPEESKVSSSLPADKNTLATFLCSVEEFTKDFQGRFYSKDQIVELQPATAADRFYEFIAKENSDKSAAQTHASCLGAICASFTREILLNLLASGETALEDSLKREVRSEASFQTVCDLVHSVLGIAQNMRTHYLNPH